MVLPFRVRLQGVRWEHSEYAVDNALVGRVSREFVAGAATRRLAVKLLHEL